MAWNWNFKVKNNYRPYNGGYWIIIITKDNFTLDKIEPVPGQSYYSPRYDPNKNEEISFRAETVKMTNFLSGDASKYIQVHIGHYGKRNEQLHSRAITFRVKLSDAIIANWHYYKEQEVLADQLLENLGFDIEIEMNDKGELVTKVQQNDL